MNGITISPIVQSQNVSPPLVSVSSPSILSYLPTEPSSPKINLKELAARHIDMNNLIKQMDEVGLECYKDKEIDTLCLKPGHLPETDTSLLSSYKVWWVAAVVFIGTGAAVGLTVASFGVWILLGLCVAGIACAVNAERLRRVQNKLAHQALEIYLTEEPLKVRTFAFKRAFINIMNEEPLKKALSQIPPEHQQPLRQYFQDLAFNRFERADLEAEKISIKEKLKSYYSQYLNNELAKINKRITLLDREFAALRPQQKALHEQLSLDSFSSRHTLSSPFQSDPIFSSSGTMVILDADKEKETKNEAESHLTSATVLPRVLASGQRFSKRQYSLEMSYPVATSKIGYVGAIVRHMPQPGRSEPLSTEAAEVLFNDVKPLLETQFAYYDFCRKNLMIQEKPELYEEIAKCHNTVCNHLERALKDSNVQDLIRKDQELACKIDIIMCHAKDYSIPTMKIDFDYDHLWHVMKNMNYFPLSSPDFKAEIALYKQMQAHFHELGKLTDEKEISAMIRSQMSEQHMLAGVELENMQQKLQQLQNNWEAFLKTSFGSQEMGKGTDKIQGACTGSRNERITLQMEIDKLIAHIAWLESQLKA